MRKDRQERGKGDAWGLCTGSKAENPMQPTVQILRGLLDAATESILLMDRHGTVLTLNKTAAKRLGKPAKELLGLTAKEAAACVGPAALIRSRVQRLREVVRTGRSIRVDEQRAGLTFDMNYSAIRDERGKVSRVAIFARDVTEQRRVEQALRESENRYRTVVESAGEAISVVDSRGVFLFLNKTAAQSLGARPAELVGKTMWDLFPRPLADRQVAAVREVIEMGVGLSRVVLSEVRAGQRWYNTTIQPLRDGRGKVTAALVVVRDVHDLKIAQEELDQFRDRMGRAERLASLGTLSATVVHELTQPLTVIRLSLSNALAETPGVGAMNDLRMGLAAMSRVQSILDGFRTFAGKAPKKAFRRVDPRVVAERVVALLAPAARRARVSLYTKGLQGLPRIRCNEGDLEQVFFALIQNAIHAADGHLDRQIRMDGGVKGNWIEVRFADTCGGIQPQHADRLFEPFFTTKPPGAGTGLGLCIVQRIVTAAGGTVVVKNRWGRGATFVIRWPHGKTRSGGRRS